MILLGSVADTDDIFMTLLCGIPVVVELFVELLKCRVAADDGIGVVEFKLYELAKLPHK